MVKDNTDSKELQATDMQRRQLLRGLSAVPVVATLTPVSASTLSMACTEKAPPDLPPDTYSKTNNNVTYQCLKKDANVGIPEGFNATVDGNPTPVYTKTPGTAALGEYEYRKNGQTRQKQCVIYIDGDSQLTFQAKHNNPIAASCLMSLGITKIT